MIEKSGVETYELTARTAREKLRTNMLLCWFGAKQKIQETKGQGTTEYAILVGVLVVIAIIAVLAFRDKLQELWTSISDGITKL